MLEVGPLLTAQTPTTFESAAEAARLALREDRPIEAAHWLDRALELDPQWEEGWWYRAGIWYQQDRLPEAARAYRAVTALNPAMGPAWLMLGLTQYRRGDYHRARDSIERAVSLGLGGNEELRFSAYFHLGALLTRFEEYERAFTILFPLAKNHSQNPYLREALGICVLRAPYAPPELPAERRELVRRVGEAVAHWAVEDTPRAEQAFEGILRDFPAERNVHYVFGQFLGVRNQERALGLFRRELEISPEHVPARLQLAWQHLNRGDPERALQWAREAAGFQSQSPSVRYVMGRVFLDLRQVDEAISELEAALTQMPASTQIRGALARAYFQAGRLQDARRQQAEIDRLRAELRVREEGLILGAERQAP
jgi:tetratricopeptide (TPR) repeat protein